jgi:thiol:disulfide interchange protein
MDIRSISITGLMSLAVFVSATAVSAQQKFPGGFGGPRTFGKASEESVDLELTAVLVQIDEQTVELQVKAGLPKTHYIYSMNPVFDGHSEITLTQTGSLVAVAPQWSSDHEPKVVNDPDLGTLEKFIGGVTWSKRLRVKSGALPATVTITGELSGQFCSSGDGAGGTCTPLLPPRPFTATLETQTTNTAGTDAGAGAVSGGTKSTITLVPEIAQGKAGNDDAIRYEISLTPANPAVGQQVTLSVQATMLRPWHTFALDQDPDMFGTPTEILLSEVHGLQPVSESFTPSAPAEVEHPSDDVIHRVHYDNVTWTQSFQCTDTAVSVSGSINFQLCNEKSCLAPSTIDFSVASTEAPAVVPGGGSDRPPAGSAGESQFTGKRSETGADGLAAFLIAAAGAGFLALLTPCVFPMIPITVAFFLKQEERQAGSSLKLALVYSLTMVGAFTILGLLGAVLFGPTSLQAAANNRWLNLIFAGLFLMFGLQLMGLVREIQIPSWLLTWSSRREAVGGVIGVVFMALTFTLVSFTCTFSFVGTLLILAAQGSYYWPVVGMLAFSAAFASPFFLLAMFPSMLKQMPKSGGWMSDVKVSIGLIEMALVPKFLSVADIGFSPTRTPRWITYNVFMWSWIIIAALVGLFLLSGQFMKSRSSASRLVKISRFVVALGFVAFAGYLGAGMSTKLPAGGSVWRLVAAFAPPDIHIRQTDNLGLVISHHSIDYSLEFEKAVAEASESDRPMFVDFTGVNCVNCRQMERTVLASAAVTEGLKSLVCAQLYTDEVPGVPTAEKRNELRSMNIALQKNLVQDVTLPYYAVLSSDGKTVLAKFEGLDSTGGTEFRNFLDFGLEQWKHFRKTQDVAAGSDVTGENRQ